MILMLGCIKGFCGIKLRAIDALVICAKVSLVVQSDADLIRKHHSWMACHKTGLCTKSCSGLCIPEPRGRHVFTQRVSAQLVA